MNKLIEDQLNKVNIADLSNYNKETNTYFIPQVKSIKLEENKAYLIHIKDAFFYNEVLKVNWNNNTQPAYRYLKVDISKIVGKMIKLIGIGYDILNQKDTSTFWSGWIPLDNIEVLEKL